MKNTISYNRLKYIIAGKLRNLVHNSFYVSFIGKIKSYSNRKGTESYPIDFVITWTDSDDVEWQNEKNKYYKLTDTYITDINNPVERYRNWDLLAYWFRAVEKYAPWVHAIYIVTCGHKPDWLNTNNSKIRFVTHEDFIPPEYLPTFCSDVIELNLLRIEELSEHFIYFNDDFFLTRPVKPEDFFENGMPKTVAIAQPIKVSENVKPWQYRFMNNYAVINASFNIREVMKKDADKWFSKVIGAEAVYNRRAFENGYISGMKSDHNVMPFLKESFKQLWQEHYSILDETSRSKFRTYRDVTIYLPNLWSIFQGRFVPVPFYYYGPQIELTPSSIDRAVVAIQKEENIAVCLNDGSLTKSEDVEMLRDKLKNAFEEKFPDKSSFEL